jgi:hypothetical protein
LPVFRKTKSAPGPREPSEKRYSIAAVPASGPLPGKRQPALSDGAPKVKDFLAPSSVREVAPGDGTAGGRATHYWVEVGATAEAVRYYRSFVAVITGGATQIGCLDSLYAGDFGRGDCDVAVHVRPTDPAREAERLRRRIIAIESDLDAETDTSRTSDLSQELDGLRAQRARLVTGLEKPYYVTIQAVGSAVSLDAARRYWNALVRRLAGQGLILRACDTYQLPAWLAASPLGEDVFRRFGLFRTMESSNVADLFPFGLGGISHRTGVVLGRDELGRLVFYDGWHPRLENANIVIFGRSGAGKSVAVKTLTYRSALAGVRTAIIDWEGEYRVVVEAAGCPYIEIGPNSKHRLNIFDVEVEEGEDGTRRVHLEESVKAVEAVALRMLRTLDPSLITGSFRVRLSQAVRRLYAARGITEDPESLFEAAPGAKVGWRRKEMPTFSDLVRELAADPETAAAAELLRVFTREGGSASQSVFDGQTTVDIGEAPIVGFGLVDLDEETMRPIGTFVVTKWVWERIAKRRRAQKKRILVDEAQVAMDDPETAVWLENAFRRARKLNVSMCAVTQGFEVFLRVPQGMGILKNAPTKVLLKQEAVDIDAVKGRFNLSEGEALYLLGDLPKGEGILRVGEESCRIYFELMPEELRLFETNPSARGDGA